MRVTLIFAVLTVHSLFLANARCTKKKANPQLDSATYALRRNHTTQILSSNASKTRNQRATTQQQHISAELTGGSEEPTTTPIATMAKNAFSETVEGRMLIVKANESATLYTNETSPQKEQQGTNERTNSLSITATMSSENEKNAHQLTTEKAATDATAVTESQSSFSVASSALVQDNPTDSINVRAQEMNGGSATGLLGDNGNPLSFKASTTPPEVATIMDPKLPSQLMMPITGNENTSINLTIIETTVRPNNVKDSDDLENNEGNLIVLKNLSTTTMPEAVLVTMNQNTVLPLLLAKRNNSSITKTTATDGDIKDSDNSIITGGSSLNEENGSAIITAETGTLVPQKIAPMDAQISPETSTNSIISLSTITTEDATTKPRNPATLINPKVAPRLMDAQISPETSTNSIITLSKITTEDATAMPGNPATLIPQEIAPRLMDAQISPETSTNSIISLSTITTEDATTKPRNTATLINLKVAPRLMDAQISPETSTNSIITLSKITTEDATAMPGNPATLIPQKIAPRLMDAQISPETSTNSIISLSKITTEDATAMPGNPATLIHLKIAPRLMDAQISPETSTNSVISLSTITTEDSTAIPGNPVSVEDSSTTTIPEVITAMNQTITPSAMETALNETPTKLVTDTIGDIQPTIDSYNLFLLNAEEETEPKTVEKEIETNQELSELTYDEFVYDYESTTPKDEQKIKESSVENRMLIEKEESEDDDLFDDLRLMNDYAKVPSENANLKSIIPTMQLEITQAPSVKPKTDDLTGVAFRSFNDLTTTEESEALFVSKVEKTVLGILRNPGNDTLNEQLKVAAFNALTSAKTLLQETLQTAAIQKLIGICQEINSSIKEYFRKYMKGAG